MSENKPSPFSDVDEFEQKPAWPIVCNLHGYDKESKKKTNVNFDESLMNSMLT